MLKTLKILTIDNNLETLRKKSKDIPINEIKTPKFQNFLDNLKQTMKKSKLQSGWEAAGLSAIQVGEPINVFIAINFNTNQIEEYINPKVKELGNAKDTHIEGCLSFPVTTGYVKRAKRCKITYYDREANTKVKQLSGFNARVVLHEYDHLMGILFIDRVVTNADNS